MEIKQSRMIYCVYDHKQKGIRGAYETLDQAQSWLVTQNKSGNKLSSDGWEMFDTAGILYEIQEVYYEAKS